MATLSDLVAQLKIDASIEDSEGFSAGSLNKWVTDALAQHNSRLTFATLPVREEDLVLILAQVKLCYVRAAVYAKLAPLTGTSGVEQNTDTPFTKLMKMAKALMTRYTEMVNAMGIGNTGESVICGDLIVNDDQTGTVVPYTVAPALPPITLARGASESLLSGSTLILSWEQEASSLFVDYAIFHMTGSEAILQSWNFQSATGVPGINDSATRLATYSIPTLRSLKVTGLTLEADFTNRFVVVALAKSGRYVLSNELSLTGTV